MNPIGFSLLVLVAVLTGVGHICFKMVAVRDLSLKQKLLAPLFVFGTGCFLLGPVLAIVAAEHVSFTVLFAMTALNYVFILIFSYWLLNEPVDSRKILGVLTIVVGLTVIATGKGQPTDAGAENWQEPQSSHLLAPEPVQDAGVFPSSAGIALLRSLPVAT